MELHINKRKRFNYVDYLHIGNYDISPLETGYGVNYVHQLVEVDIGRDDVDVEDFINDFITEVQLCDTNGDEILLHGTDILDYFTEITFYDNRGKAYIYDVKEHLI